MMATPSEHVLNPLHRHGHTIRDQTNKDNARVINGDVFNIGDISQQSQAEFLMLIAKRSIRRPLKPLTLRYGRRIRLSE